MECAYQPFNWTETGAQSVGAVKIYGEGKEGLYANGYDVQIAQYVANKLGLKLEVYAIEWDSLIPAVQAGTVDAIVAGMSPTSEREEQIDFTNVYYESNLVVIYKK
jgi:ABC-type amino acid transport substrate-binding protein